MSKKIKKEVVEVPEAIQELGNKVVVRALLNLQGHFLLPYDAGQEFEINVNQAQEMVEAKYAEYVK